LHDPLSIQDLCHDELDQARETGYDVTALERRLSGLDTSDQEGHEGLYAEIYSAPRDQTWPYDEPDDLERIMASWPNDSQASSAVAPEDLDDRVLGGWLGRIAGCNLGKPVENGEMWTAHRIRDYLELAGAWPLRDYFPVLDPMPPDLEFRENWVETTRGLVNGSARDDDIDYAILGLHLLELHGEHLSKEHVAQAWLSLLPYLQVYTAERATYCNLLNGLDAGRVASHRNPYREWIGALIRGDAFGWTNPGNPRRAAEMAYRDASLSHVANGIYGEMWSAALVASAFTSGSARAAYDRALLYVPAQSRLAHALVRVRELRDQGATWEEAVERIQAELGHYSWVHTINNAAIIAAGLLWGEDEFASVGLTVSGGWDTDSNGATAGSVLGVLTGASKLPGHLIDPLHDRVRSALFGFDNSSISDLAARTVKLVLTQSQSPARSVSHGSPSGPRSQ
jgi:ADP-ribosylglycohydrolase